VAEPHATEHAQLRRLAEEQAALRRVATLVARGEAPDSVFAAVAEEVARVLQVSAVSIVRYEDDSTATECASVSEQGELFQVGTRWSLAGTSVMANVRMSGRPARIDHYAGLEGEIAEEVRRVGIRSSVGTPIVVDGLLWGATVVSTTKPGPLAEETEARLARFGELVATAISNTEARSQIERLAEQQAALRRVATLVAGGVPPEDLFGPVAREVGRLLGADVTHVGRCEPAGAVVRVGGWIGAGDGLGDRLPRLAFTGSEVGAPILVEGRTWGVLLASPKAESRLPVDANAQLAAFAELIGTAISNAQDRAEVARLAEEQAALRRVATLVAETVRPSDLFGAVIEETGTLLGADFAGMIRYESGDTVSPVAAWAAEGEHPGLPDRWTTEEGDPATLVREALQPVRIDDWQSIPGPIASFARELGISSSVGSPILVEGQLWGALAVHSKGPEPLPVDTEARLLNFTELVATSLSNAQARADVRRLGDEQAALRRVATLVASEPPPQEVFGAVAREVGWLLRVEETVLMRYEDDVTAAVLATWGERTKDLEVGTRMPVEGKNAAARVHRTGRPARVHDYATASGAIGTRFRGLGFQSAVGSPIVVDARLWGVIVAARRVAEPLPADTESRLERFSELVATAISNVQVRSDLAASRSRIVAASDEERRRVVRDLHDGAQQRLVHTVITLKLAERALEDGDASASKLISGALDQAQRTTVEVRELSHGILPAALRRGGLRVGVEALASRMPMPVAIDLSVGPLPGAVEATGYFVVAEALTNVAKHSRAESAAVTARIEEETLRVEVRDDGIGGARPDGNGLRGLGDRLAAVDGRLRVDSPTGGGTLIAAAIPVHPKSAAAAARGS
jgi:GAF domain-containing protein